MSDSVDPVERGWKQLEVGDLDGAVAALRDAEKRDPEDADVLCLGAAIATAEGRIDDALDLLERAADADPDYAHPLLQAAEIELYSLADPEAALELAQAALEVADGDEERADALLLCAEAGLELALAAEEDGEPADTAPVRAHLEQVEALGVRDPIALTRSGHLYLMLGELAHAERSFLSAIEQDAADADAHHGLGLVYERRGDRDAMIESWLDTLRLDAAASPPPWHLSQAELQEVAEQAMAELPAEVIERLANVPILIDDLPSADLVEEGYDPRLMGLFSGIPLPDKSSVGDGDGPSIDAIHLFQKNLERDTADREELAEEIRITVLHETAHFFGLEDDDLDEIGLG